MRKIVLFAVTVLVISGCSGSRRAGKTRGEGKPVKENAITFENIVQQNISNQNYYIEKADITIDAGGSEMSFMATIKFVLPDEYLISLRMIAGIEAARIYINSDTVLINDRLNRKLYYGDPDNIGAKYGISPRLLPVIFGDFISDETGKGDMNDCQNGKVFLDTFVKGAKLIYEVDCSRTKVTGLQQEGSYRNSLSELSYGNYIKSGHVLTPSLIKYTHNSSGSSVQIKIDRLIVPWDGTIEFIPGNRYEKIQLR